MPLNKSSPFYLHTLQNLSLLLLSLIFLPINTFILLWSLILRPKLAPEASKDAIALLRKAPGFKSQVILVTGVGMSKGLTLARSFHLAGHTVIGADFEPHGALVCGRVSRSLHRFYTLAKPTSEADSTGYVASLLHIIKSENVSLWVSCSGVASAVSDGQAKEAVEAQTSCKAIQYDVATTAMLHEKHTFIQRCSELGLGTPETHVVTSRVQLREIFADARVKGIKYIMKTVAMDDANRGDMTLFPFASEEETERATVRINASEGNPWIAQQFVKGKEYCTHALVVRGQVKVFVACPSLELLMHYEALPYESPLSQAMLAFTRQFARKSGDEFTGHLSFDYLVTEEDQAKTRAQDITLWPIECNPRAHTAVVLFRDSAAEMVKAYLSALDKRKTGYEAGEGEEETPVIPRAPMKWHWVGHDFVACCVVPVLQLASGNKMDGGVVDGWKRFFDYVIEWKDGTYEVWDPLPWWWLYHVYWPTQFLWAAVTGTRWSRVNVSTTKMFMC